MYFAPRGTGRDMGRLDGTSDPSCLPPSIPQKCTDVHPPDVQTSAVTSRCSSHHFLPRNMVSILFVVLFLSPSGAIIYHR